jgi:hypothetical protein
MKHLIASVWMISSLVLADHIKLDNVKSAAGLSFGSRLLIARLASGDVEMAANIGRDLAADPMTAEPLLELSEMIEDFEHLALVYSALRARIDLTDLQQKRIRDQLNPLVGNMNGGRAAVLKQQGLYLIADYPSADNEALLIRFLSERKDWRDSDYTDVAADGLGRIGTPNALQALREYAARAKPPAGYESRAYNAAIEAEKQIMARSSAGTNSGQPQSSTINGTASKENKATNDQAATPSEEPASSTPWSVIVVLIVAAIGLLWLLVKKRK